MHDTGEEALLLIALLSDSEEDGDESAVAVLGYDVAAKTNNFGDSSLHVGLQVPIVSLSVRGRHEYVDVLSNDINEGEAEELLSGLVESIDETLVIDDNGGHREVVEDLTLHLDERLLLGLVASLFEDTDEVESGTSGFFSELKIDGDDRAVLLNGNDIASLADDAGDSSSQVVAEVCVVVGSRILGRQNVNISANHLGLRVSKDALDSLVDVLHDTLLVDDNGGIKDELEHTEHVSDELGVRLLLSARLAFLASTMASRRSSELLGVLKRTTTSSVARHRVGAVLLVQVELDSHAALSASFRQALLEVGLAAHSHLVTIRVKVLHTKLALELLLELTAKRTEGCRRGQTN